MFDVEPFVYRNWPEVQPYGNPITDLAVNCRFCDDTKHHLHVSLEKQVCHCFRCGYKRSWVGLVMDVTGLDYFKAVGELYKLPKLRGDLKAELYKGSDDPVAKTEAKLPDDFQPLYGTFKGASHLGQVAMSYLSKKRGFGQPYWKRYHLGIAPSQGYRVIIPIERGYWQGRALYDWIQPKYMNPKNPARDVLFNAVALRKYDEIVITEGAFSAMAVGANAVALIGKEPTQEKVERLLAAPAARFIIALEPGAFKTMSTLADKLYRNGREVIIWHYQTGDPAEADAVMEVMSYGLKDKLKLMFS